jgi:hypothetical protein
MAPSIMAHPALARVCSCPFERGYVSGSYSAMAGRLWP